MFARNRDSTARTVINVGGAGSSKSYSIAQLMISKLCTEQNKQFIITRKTMPALKRSAYKQIVDLLEDYGLYKLGDHNRSDHVFTLNNNEFWFFGLDEPSKAKSIAGGASYVWMEEADEFTYDDYVAFVLQLRRHTDKELNQIFLTFNPIDGNGWIPTKLVGQDGVEVIHSTIDDNPYADPDYVKALKTMASADENYYHVYVLGEWGRLENLIFPNYTLVDFLPDKWDSWAYGLDFGYVHPTALVKVVVSEGKTYWQEMLCQSKLTNSDLIERLSHLEKGDIYADSAEPQRIMEISRAGYTIFPANKDVRLGIDLARRHPIHITKDSIALIKQIRGYRRKKDKEGRVLEEPVKIDDDTIDAGRYALMGLTERFGYPTARPTAEGPIRSLGFGDSLGKILDRWMKRDR